MMKPGEYAAGTVASIQNDENGGPTWIISGLWKGSLITDKSKEGVGSQSINATNSTATTKILLLPAILLTSQLQGSRQCLT